MKKYVFILLSLLIVNCLEAQNLPRLIPVMKENKWGFVNRKLQVVIKPAYDVVIYPFTGYRVPKSNTIDSMAYVKQGDERFFINTKGSRVVNLPKNYSYNNRLSAPIIEESIYDEEQEALQNKKREAEFLTDSITGKIGIIERYTKAVLVAPQFDKISKIYTDENLNDNLYAVQRNKKWGVINAKGKVLLNNIYDFIEGVRYIDSKKKVYFTAFKDKVTSVISNNTVIISGEQFIMGAGSNQPNIGIYINRTDNLGYLYDFEKQKFINKIGFEQMGNTVFEEGIMKVERNGKTFYIDTTGKEFILK